MRQRILIALLGLSLVYFPASANQSASGPVIQPELAEKLTKVKRIYVDSFGDDQISKVLYAMVVNSLTKSGRFIVTENKDKADAVLKGAALEKTSQELHSSSESTAVSSAAGHHSGQVSGDRNSVQGSSSGGFRAGGAAIGDSVTSTETIDHAALAVRLVHADGDLIWATTQESLGAKYKGASADVADKIVKQLLHDLENLEEKGDVTKRVQ
jgi:curli biogenesis system outer membrane secretion channel CsgG